ncbi:hypothetical protein CDAR_295521 [Caerostris darwini]|uniref:Uncharacterized protein n=1 Tax=Caerostris darwini TaxID=1538125 RepID=A0AAV4NFC3_9ARAC|nr:hypothetical protein CDAR_295521 [Caerostris darwini]
MALSRDTTIDHELRSALTASTSVMKVEIVYQNLWSKYEGPHFFKDCSIVKSIEKPLGINCILNARRKTLPEMFVSPNILHEDRDHLNKNLLCIKECVFTCHVLKEFASIFNSEKERKRSTIDSCNSCMRLSDSFMRLPTRQCKNPIEKLLHWSF